MRTPGLWEFDEQTKVVGDHRKIVVDPLAYASGKEAIANGRLIAAAPDMLHALHLAYSALAGPGVVVRHAREAIQEAINKAEGR